MILYRNAILTYDPSEKSSQNILSLSPRSPRVVVIGKSSSIVKKSLHSYAAIYISDEFVVIILGKTNVDEAASYK